MFYKLWHAENVIEWDLVGTDQKQNWEENNMIRLWDKQGRWPGQRGEISNKLYTVKEVGKETEALNLEADRVLTTFYSPFQWFIFVFSSYVKFVYQIDIF